MDVALNLRLPAQCDAPASARRALRGLGRYVDDDALSRTELLVSELVTNSVRHGGLDADDPICVVITVGDRMLRAEVADPGAGFDPGAATPRPDQTGGYGLFLLEQLAQRWGVSRDGGTRVWFELPREAAGALRTGVFA